MTLCVQPDPAPDKIELDVAVGVGTVYFSVLVFGLLQHHLKKGRELIDLKPLLDSATRITKNWITRQRNGLLANKGTHDAEYRMVLAQSDVRGGESQAQKMRIGIANQPRKPNGQEYSTMASSGGETAVGTVLTVPQVQVTTDVLHPSIPVLDTLIEDPKQMLEEELNGYGILRSPDRTCLQIDTGRGCLEIAGYVCRQPSKRQIVARVRDQISPFRPREVSRSLGGIIIAGPGTGKSNFVRQLAIQCRMEYLPFNITTMIRREEVLSCFDQIVTTQSRLSSRALLVFFDEINSEIENHHVYDMFLTPLEDNYFVRNGVKFSIKPCVWVFAGTRLPGQGRRESDRNRDNSKASDFMSRIESLGIIDLTDGALPENPGDRISYIKYQQLERVYLGVALARQLHPDLTPGPTH